MVSSACSGIQKPANQSKLGFSGAGALKKTGIHMQKVNRVPQHLGFVFAMSYTYHISCRQPPSGHSAVDMILFKSKKSRCMYSFL